MTCGPALWRWGSRVFVVESDQSLSRWDWTTSIFFIHIVDLETPLEETMGAWQQSSKEKRCTPGFLVWSRTYRQSE